MTKLKVEVIEPNGFKDGAYHHEFGDIFSSEKGQYFVDLGWCKSVDTGESGTRVEGVSKIKPDDVMQKAV